MVEALTLHHIYGCYTVNNTTIVGNSANSDNVQKNCYTTNAKDNLTNLNAAADGFDSDGNEVNTEQPWIADDTTNPINGGNPILSWQKSN